MKNIYAILLFVLTIGLSHGALAAESDSDSSVFRTQQQKTKDADSDESGVRRKGPYRPQGQSPDSGGMYQPKGYNSGVPGKVIDNNGYGSSPEDGKRSGSRAREETGTMGGFGPSGPPARSTSPGTGASDMHMGTPTEPAPSTAPGMTPGTPSGSGRTPAGPSPTSPGPSPGSSGSSNTSPSGNR